MRCLPLRRNPPHGIQHPIRRINPIQILRDLGAEKSPRHRMLRIALNFSGAPIFYRDQHPASIGTIVRTGGVDDVFMSHDYRVRLAH